MENQLGTNRYSQTNEPDSVADMSIILVCWNNKDYLDPCLKSLYDGGLRCSFDVVVVDNGSTDGSQEMLRGKYPEVRIIQNDHNVGLAKACNQGIKATNGRYALLLNNDTLVNGPSLDAMADFLDANSDVGAVGGRLLNEDGSFQAGYATFTTLLEEILVVTRLGEKLWPGFPSHKNSDKPIAAGWLSSACLLLRRETLDQVGLLDEEYFIYGDEADLQYRIQKAGWKVYYLPHATTLHYGGRSMNRWRRRRMVYRGRMLFYKKNYSVLQTTVVRVLFGILSFLKILTWVVSLLVPSRREMAQRELQSNIDVIKLCLKLE